MSDDAALTALAAKLGRRLQSQHMSLATAESCTGGWIAKVLTDVAGSSSWFERGFVCYSNAAKNEALGVTAETLSRDGAVSEASAAELARGAIEHSRAGLAVSVTGIAGPGGGSAEKPVGLVWFAWHRRDGRCATRVEYFAGDRDAIRRAAVAAALQGSLALVD